MNWSMIPLGLFGVLNLLLSVLALRQARGAAGAAALFALAGGLVLGGMWSGNPVVVGAGCLLGALAPVWMGYLIFGRPRWLHHAVRVMVVALLFRLWMNFGPSGR